MKQLKYLRSNYFLISLVKIFLIFVVPLILTIIVSISRHTTYEFVDEEAKHMVAPATQNPYLSILFSDLFFQLGMDWHKFCIKNNSYSENYSLPQDLAVKVNGMENFIKIHYKEKRCFPILKNDVLYDVAWGGFIIPNKEWADKNFKCNGDSCVLKFNINEILNFEVYTILSLTAKLIIYVLFAAAMFGMVKFVLAVYKFILKC